MVYHAGKPFLCNPILAARQENPTMLRTRLSPFQLSFQQAYETICIVGLVFTLTLLISLTLGGRRRHPVVIAFISTAVLNYCSGLLPWFFDFWGKQISPAFSGHDIPTHIACQVNSVFGSYLPTVIPSFAAAFIGEALRITWKISKMTNTPTSKILLEHSINHTSQTRTSKLMKFLAQEQDQKNDPPVHFPRKLDPELYHATDEPGRKVVIPRHRWSDGAREMLDVESTSVSSMRVEQHSVKRNSILKPGSNGKGEFILCLVPILCGLPQLVSILMVYLHTSETWIFLDIINCRVRSKSVDNLAFITLLFVLALTASLCVVMLSILCSMRRSFKKYGMSNLDKAILIPIGFLTFQSVVGCLMISMIYLRSDDKYHAALDLFGIINPVVSAVVLTDREFFSIWHAWIFGSMKSLATRLGLEKLNRYTSLSKVLNQDCSPDQSKESFGSTNWVPPKPSYPRCHRPISTSVSIMSDSDMNEPEGQNSQSPFSFRSKLSRQVRVTRPARFLSFRKIDREDRASVVPCSQNSASRRKGFSVLRRAVTNHHCSVLAKSRKSVLALATFEENSPDVSDRMNKIRHLSFPQRCSQSSAQLKMSQSTPQYRVTSRDLDSNYLSLKNKMNSQKVVRSHTSN